MKLSREVQQPIQKRDLTQSYVKTIEKMDNVCETKESRVTSLIPNNTKQWDTIQP